MAKKRTNNKEAARRANARARETRERSRAGAVVGVGAGVAGAMLAPIAADYIPGPSATEIKSWKAKKPGLLTPFKSMRVLLPLGLGIGVAALGGDGVIARATAFCAGGMSTAFYNATAAELGAVDNHTLAVQTKKE